MLSPYHPMQLALGLIVWAVWFVVLYGGLSVACVLAPPPVEQGAYTWINGALLLGTLLVTALLLYWAYGCWKTARANIERDGASRRLIVRVAMGVHLAGALASFSVGAVVITLPPCV